ncbi:MAG: PRC-barrel domain-containing protein [Erythrobacter sp.]|jgi:sporulation protein YlmC with PRC-barrel domain|nr:PRC-barrel domain-containing protein [Erythrobacter sp.]
MHIETDENHSLISAEKVDGTTVYSHDGDKAGTVKSVMINKRSGQVEHAVLSIGGFLGLGSEYHAIPWDKLDYDTELGGYRLGVSEDQLRKGPTFSENESGTLTNRDYETRVYSHYGSTPYFA